MIRMISAEELARALYEDERGLDGPFDQYPEKDRVLRRAERLLDRIAEQRFYNPDSHETERVLHLDEAGFALKQWSKSDYRWLIEAPGPHYLFVERLTMSANFAWTRDHNQALAFRSEKQASDLMRAVRERDNGVLFGFERALGNAKPVEHGWLTTDAPTGEPVDNSVEVFSD